MAGERDVQLRQHALRVREGRPRGRHRRERREAQGQDLQERPRQQGRPQRDQRRQLRGRGGRARGRGRLEPRQLRPQPRVLQQEPRVGRRQGQALREGQRQDRQLRRRGRERRRPVQVVRERRRRRAVPGRGARRRADDGNARLRLRPVWHDHAVRRDDRRGHRGLHRAQRHRQCELHRRVRVGRPHGRPARGDHLLEPGREPRHVRVRRHREDLFRRALPRQPRKRRAPGAWRAVRPHRYRQGRLHRDPPWHRPRGRTGRGHQGKQLQAARRRDPHLAHHPGRKHHRVGIHCRLDVRQDARHAHDRGERRRDKAHVRREHRALRLQAARRRGRHLHVRRAHQRRRLHGQGDHPRHERLRRGDSDRRLHHREGRHHRARQRRADHARRGHPLRHPDRLDHHRRPGPGRQGCHRRPRDGDDGRRQHDRAPLHHHGHGGRCNEPPRHQLHHLDPGGHLHRHAQRHQGERDGLQRHLRRVRARHRDGLHEARRQPDHHRNAHGVLPAAGLLRRDKEPRQRDPGDCQRDRVRERRGGTQVHHARRSQHQHRRRVRNVEGRAQRRCRRELCRVLPRGLGRHAARRHLRAGERHHPGPPDHRRGEPGADHLWRRDVRDRLRGRHPRHSRDGARRRDLQGGGRRGEERLRPRRGRHEVRHVRPRVHLRLRPGRRRGRLQHHALRHHAGRRKGELRGELREGDALGP